MFPIVSDERFSGSAWPHKQISGEVLQVRPGALYPALSRLEHQEWITAKWAKTDAGRRAKYYSLTQAGRHQLEREVEQWRRLSGAVTTIVDMA